MEKAYDNSSKKKATGLCNYIQMNIFLVILQKTLQNIAIALSMQDVHLRGVRQNYATTHINPPPTNSQTISTTHHPLPPTTTQKVDHHPAKSKIYSYITPFDIVLTVSFSLKYGKRPRFCVKFWSVRFSDSKCLLRFMIFKFVFQEFKVQGYKIYFCLFL